MRGISRSPSDRMTEDGGVAESLNVQLDNTEVAPMVEPKDVTASLGVSDTSEASMIYIHKTANYENIISVEGSKIVAYTDVGTKSVLTLTNGEKVYKIASVGNSLAVATSVQMYYLLYKENQYVNLGNKVPFPEITVETYTEDTFTRTSSAYYYYDSRHTNDTTIPPFWYFDTALQTNNFPSTEEWNSDSDGKNHSINEINSVLSETVILNPKPSPSFPDCYATPMFVRYVAELYDGSKYSSEPILCGAGDENPYKLRIEVESMQRDGDKTGLYMYNKNDMVFTIPYYKIRAKLNNLAELEDWKEMIRSIKVYMSECGSFPVNDKSTEMISREDSGIESSTDENGYTYLKRRIIANVKLRSKGNDTYYVDLLKKSGSTYLVKEIFIKEQITNGDVTIEGTNLSSELKRLGAGEYWFSELPFNKTDLELQDSLIGDDMKHYQKGAKDISSYNNQLLLIQPVEMIGFNLPELNSSRQKYYNNSIMTTRTVKYNITWVLRAINSEKSTTRSFSYTSYQKTERSIYGFQIFPDSKCYRMLVTAVKTGNNGTETIRYGDFAMKPHPYLNCSYYYGGIGKELWDLCTASSIPDISLSTYGESDNQLLVSEMDNPFFFPINKRYTFQSPIVGVGIATTALSQGQFGQYPLYVFTEDGIWAMEVAADGTFVTQKSVSRVICNNPDSVTSIDDAIIFASDRGLMLLRGSDVVNISPFMHGKHFVLKGTPKEMIEKTDFKFAIDAMQDKDAFLTFIKDASIAYDYAGQRLILLSKSNTHFQYVYQIDTQTWHKQSRPNTPLKQVINSYPECYVLGEPFEIRYLGLLDKDVEEEDSFVSFVHMIVPQLSETAIRSLFRYGESIDVTHLDADMIDDLCSRVEIGFITRIAQYRRKPTRIWDFTTSFDSGRTSLKGVITTRPFDLDHPDVKKSIKDIRVRGQFPKGAVKFILEGSDDGENFYVLSSLRGKSWKLFRLTLLCDLGPDDRISWVDIMYDTKFTNKLR